MKVAILDIDGTLFPGSLGIEILKELARDEIGHQDHIRSTFDTLRQFEQGTISYDVMTQKAYSSYAAAISGVSREIILEITQRVWQARKGDLFDFVFPLLDLLSHKGYTRLIISGSPQDAVDLLAVHLGAHRAWGSEFESRDDHFTGKLTRSPGKVGQKLKILREFAQYTPIDFRASMAIGDSITDIDLFEFVGFPFMFEPNQQLQGAPKKAGRDWPTINRHNALETISATLP